MAKFRYIAKDMQRKTHKGVSDAASIEALSRELRSQNLFLVEAKEITVQKKEYRKLKSKQLAAFCKELSTLLASGVSLVRALDIISEQEGIDAKEIYKDVLQDIRKGMPLSEAMESKQCFPELMIGMIRSGEGSGNLDMVAERLAVQYDKENKLNQQVRSAMTYPAVLMFLCVVIVILIVTFILPQFQTMFDQMEKLPLPTTILIAISDFLITQWYVALICVAVVFALFRILAGLPNVRRTLDYWKVHIVMFGKLFKIVYTARFARTLSSLYSSGMPIASAISIAGQTIGNIYIEEQFERVVIQVRSGVPLSQALKEVDGLQKKLSSTILVGEESGRLDVMLDSIAESMEAESEQATKQMVTLLEPILIMFMALVVGFILVAIMLPIYQSYAVIENS